jgi:hypothetical protein
MYTGVSILFLHVFPAGLLVHIHAFICNLFSHETLEHVVCWHTLLTMKRKLSVSDDHIYFARFHAHVHLHLISTSGLEQRKTLWQVWLIKHQYIHNPQNRTLRMQRQSTSLSASKLASSKSFISKSLFHATVCGVCDLPRRQMRPSK